MLLRKNGPVCLKFGSEIVPGNIVIYEDDTVLDEEPVALELVLSKTKREVNSFNGDDVYDTFVLCDGYVAEGILISNLTYTVLR